MPEDVPAIVPPIDNSQDRKIVTVSPMEALGLSSPPKDDLKTMTSDLHTRANKNVTLTVDDPKPKVEEKPVEKVEEKPEEKPVEKPADKPGKKEPVEPAKPVEKVEEKPVATPAKVKVGDNEYTNEELAELIAKAKKPEQQQQPPTEKKEVVTDPKKEEEDERKLDQDFIDKGIESATTRNAPWLISQEEYEKIIDGEPDGLRTLNQKLGRARLEGELEARKWAANAIAAAEQRILEIAKPASEHVAEIKAYQTETAFWERHQELAAEGDAAEGRRSLVRRIATALRSHSDPEIKARVSKLSQDEFLDEVARQTKTFLQGIGVTITPPKPKEVVVETPKVEEKPIPPVTPAPPAANKPGAAVPVKALDFQSQTARSLREY
jgi:outer membrane biosynthesis protein TonB